ncbi:MAG: hypothetical protein FGM15_08700 [Chthoniobacterales bacterium]|nr:hypothetical protein [Chthoniobacterales bacterium]
MTTAAPLKVDRWWASHYGMMVAFVYLVLAISPSPPTLTALLQTLALFTFASLGIGTFGHLLNDLTDVRQDSRSGAYNVLSTKGPVARFAFLTGALVAGIAPWWWLPTTPVVAALVASEFLLLVIYSVRPIRLKERGMLGVIADALYAYVVPNAFAVLLFDKLGGGGTPSWMIAAILFWCFCFGLERIIHHQLLDATRDEKEGVQTFVVRRGWVNSFRFLSIFVTPTVGLALVVLLAACATVSPLVPIAFAVHAVLVLAVWSRLSTLHDPSLGRLPPINLYHVIAERLIATFVWRWFALLSLIVLVIAHPQYLPLIPLHLMLFPGGALWALRHGIPHTWNLFRPGRAYGLH